MTHAPGPGAVAALARRQRAFYMATEMTCIEVICDLRKVTKNHFWVKLDLEKVKSVLYIVNLSCFAS